MTSLLSKRLLAAVALLSAFTAFEAKADLFTSCGIDLGLAGRTKTWGAFSLGGGTSIHNESGGAYIQGDVGAAGNGNVTLSGGASIYGDLYHHTGGTFHNGGNLTGNRFQDAATDALLDQAVMDAMNASAAAFALPVSPQYAGLTNINLSGHGMTILASAGSCTVLRLTNFMLSGGSTVTLQGTATQAFIINVTNQFSLSGGSKILLSGGLTWDSVLFNVVGSGKNPTLSGGSNVMSGILMATQRKVVISGGSILYGEVINNGLDLSGGSAIINPPTSGQNP